MVAAAGGFLGGARGRLLPASIPLRFFGAAVAFHLLAWLALVAGAAQWPRFGGGPGWVLAALHLLTLGVFGMSALGAGAQLLPVATRQPAPDRRWLAAIWWLYTPGVGALALGMGLFERSLLAAGAAAVALALATWGVLIARHLARARGMPGVVAHVWAALGSLAVLLVSGLALLAAWLGWPAPPRALVIELHRLFAPFGFMGMLSLGLSYILVPMFALADAPGDRRQLAAFGLALLAFALAAAAVFGVAPAALRLAALLAAAAAAGWHLHLMATALRAGMRRELGRSFRLVRLGWAGLLACLALAAALLLLPEPPPGLAAAFGLCLIGVWLLSFVLGMLQRILPFLAAMHGGAGRRAPTPSALTHDGALRIHFVCHLAALALLGLAIAADSAWVAGAGALAGAVGGLAFAVFYLVLLRRLRTTPA